TADYYTVDRRLGTNSDLAELSREVHERGMALVLDGVFNHVGRDFWAFKDLQVHGAQSAYADWFSGLRFDQRSSFGDAFDYDCWQGNHDLVELNLKKPEVRQHLFDAIRSWRQDYQIDGLRLDAADALDKDFLQALSSFCKEMDPDFWLMAEVIHGDYTQWANPEMADATTSYELYKSGWSSFNDHNFFELSYSLTRQFGPGGIYSGLKTQYNFLDNHDVSRIASALKDPAQLEALYLLMFTEPGIPSIYYGSEFGFEATKSQNDWELRPPFHLQSILDAGLRPDLRRAVARFAQMRAELPALQNGDCNVRLTTLGQIAFTRSFEGQTVLVAFNNQVVMANVGIPMPGMAGWKFRNILGNGEESFVSENGLLELVLQPNSGQAWVSSY
ncbi:MAG TPA: alpha-amylase family glycosyl hydrolase, partial [Anaerolineaceae bacterium]|nr:alpha-amylase family glycosyl hydrolase [Anaerolineaceae bacterium]